MTPATKALRLPVAPGGYPAWMPPILVKELRQGMRSQGFVATFILFQVLVAILLFIEVSIAASTLDSVQRAQAVAQFDIGFWVLLTVFLLMAMPLRAMTGLRSEIETRTLDMLVLTRLTAWRIVTGKWASLMAQSTLLLLATLPYGMIRYFVGGTNLAADAGHALLLLAGCGLLTAGGLWASGFSRALAAPLTLAMVIGPGFGGIGLTRVAGSLTGGAPLGLSVIFSLYMGALVLLFFLVGSVRRIAPVAENYSPLARLLGLCAWIPVPLAALKASVAGVQAVPLIFALFYSLAVALIELSGRDRPMKAHARPFARRGIAGRVAACFLLPGWQSGLLYVAFLWLLASLAVQFTPALQWADRSDFTIILALGFGGLAFPAVVASFFRHTRHPAVPYLAVVLVTGLLAFGATVLRQVTNEMAYIEIAAFVPGAGFFLAFGKVRPALFAGQGIVIAVVCIVGLIRSRPYFERVLEITRPGTA